jgi:DNA helicase II / ATP-dependent DNA helicase PcrA
MKELSADDSEEGLSRMQNSEELLNALKDFSEKEQTLFPMDEETGEIGEMEENASEPRSLDLFMQEIALMTDADSDDKEDNNKVTLMTIHAAKGLEFPFVYIVGLEENLSRRLWHCRAGPKLKKSAACFMLPLPVQKKG